MRIPGFTGEMSLKPAGNHYQRTATQSAVTGAVPATIDPCKRCSHLTGCARFRCFCQCNGGIWVPGGGPHFPCGECT